MKFIILELLSVLRSIGCSSDLLVYGPSSLVSCSYRFLLSFDYHLSYLLLSFLDSAIFIITFLLSFINSSFFSTFVRFVLCSFSLLRLSFIFLVFPLYFSDLVVISRSWVGIIYFLYLPWSIVIMNVLTLWNGKGDGIY